MYPSPAPWLSAPCSPYAYQYAYDPCGWLAPPWSGAMVSYVPVACAPIPLPCAASFLMAVPHELSADATTTPQVSLIGGKSDVHLSLEYLVDAGATTPEVKVVVTWDGTTSTWTDTGIAEGYHVKENLVTVNPGAKVQLEVKNATARLRWCETICC